ERLHDPAPSRAILPADNRLVAQVRRQRRDDRRLRIFAGREPAVLDFGLLRRLPPIVVTGQKRTALVKLKRRILQGSGNTEVTQGGTDRADNYALVRRPRRDHPPDQGVVSSQHAKARGNISQNSRRSQRRQPRIYV